MAKPNYAFAKRQRDLVKKQKKEEKRQRKLAEQQERAQLTGATTGADPSDAEKTSR